MSVLLVREVRKYARTKQAKSNVTDRKQSKQNRDEVCRRLIRILKAKVAGETDKNLCADVDRLCRVLSDADNNWSNYANVHIVSGKHWASIKKRGFSIA